MYPSRRIQLEWPCSHLPSGSTSEQPSVALWPQPWRSQRSIVATDGALVVATCLAVGSPAQRGHFLVGIAISFALTSSTSRPELASRWVVSTSLSRPERRSPRSESWEPALVSRPRLALPSSRRTCPLASRP